MTWRKLCARIVNHIGQRIPQQCVLCSASTSQQPCQYCVESIEYLPLDVFGHNLMSWPKIAASISPFEFHHMTAACEYTYPFSHWIKNLKFNRNMIAANALAQCFSFALRGRTKRLPDYLIAAPLHHTRYFKRLFNQSREIALALQRLTNIQVLDGVLTRQQNGIAQSKLDRTARLNNAALQYRAYHLPANTQRIAIVDDVLTTGATMDAMITAIQYANPDVIVEAWPMAISLSRID